MRKALKRVYCVFIAALLVLLTAATGGETAMRAYAEGLPEFYLKTSSSSGYPGDEIIVSLYCTNNTGKTLSSFDGKLCYDQTMLEYKNPYYTSDHPQTKAFKCEKTKENGVLGYTFRIRAKRYSLPATVSYAER